MLLFLANGNKRPGLLFRYIASAVYGPVAFTNGVRMVFLGAGFHFLIALFWVSVFFGLYPHLAVLRSNGWIVAAGYGLLVWMCMNLVVLPLSRAKPRPFSLAFMLINMVILVITIGLPCVWLAGR
jgi:hypothetical protein